MNRTAWLLFIALAIVWGLPYFCIKIALVELAPAMIAFARVALGALILACFVPRADWAGLRRHVLAIAAIAFLDVALPFYLIANGERSVSSSLAGLLLSAMPIAVTLFALAIDRSERIGRAQVAGLVIGIAGVAALLGVNIGSTGASLRGVLLIVGAILSYSIGVLMIRRWARGLPKLPMTAGMLVLAALMLAPAATFALPARIPSPATIASLAVLGALCTSAAYVMYFTLIASAGAIRATIVTYLNPAVAAVLGVTILHESLSALSIAGLLLIIVGSWLSTSGKPPAANPIASPKRTSFATVHARAEADGTNQCPTPA